jgi:hypothetical protein
MYHTIEFAAELTADLETSPKEPLDRHSARASPCLGKQAEGQPNRKAPPSSRRST